MYLRKRGFTLMELLIVIAIIGTISAISVPRMEGTISDARGAVFNAHAGAIITAVEQWRAAHLGFTAVVSGVLKTEDLDVKGLTAKHYLQEEALYYKEDDGGIGSFQVYPITNTTVDVNGIVITVDTTKQHNLVNKTFYLTAKNDADNNGDTTDGTEYLIYVDDEAGLTTNEQPKNWDDLKSK